MVPIGDGRTIYAQDGEPDAEFRERILTAAVAANYAGEALNVIAIITGENLDSVGRQLHLRRAENKPWRIAFRLAAR